jgi:murein L,D-transpeptidase YcbB/YkuD
MVAAALAASLPATALAQSPSPKLEAAIKAASGSDREVQAFYKARSYRPLWTAGDRLGPEADRLLDLIETADAEGLDPDDYRPRRLRDAIEDARENGSPKALARAETALTRSFAEYARTCAGRARPAWSMSTRAWRRPRRPRAPCLTKRQPPLPSRSIWTASAG